MRDIYLQERNSIINSFFKSIFYRKRLAELDKMLEDIDYEEYLVASKDTRELIESLRIKGDIE